MFHVATSAAAFTMQKKNGISSGLSRAKLVLRSTSKPGRTVEARLSDHGPEVEGAVIEQEWIQDEHHEQRKHIVSAAPCQKSWRIEAETKRVQTARAS